MLWPFTEFSCPLPHGKLWGLRKEAPSGVLLGLSVCLWLCTSSPRGSASCRSLGKVWGRSGMGRRPLRSSSVLWARGGLCTPLRSGEGVGPVRTRSQTSEKLKHAVARGNVLLPFGSADAPWKAVGPPQKKKAPSDVLLGLSVCSGSAASYGLSAGFCSLEKVWGRCGIGRRPLKGSRVPWPA